MEPVIAATVAAAGADPEAPTRLAPILDQLALASGAALAAVIRRIVGGDRDGRVLQDLDPIGTAVVGQIMTRLAQPATR